MGTVAAEIITPESLAAATGVPAHTIRRFCREGRLKATKVGSSWSIDPDAAEEWAENYQRYGRQNG